MTEIRRCMQDKCGYWNYGTGCRKCDECDTTANVINKNCDNINLNFLKIPFVLGYR